MRLSHSSMPRHLACARQREPDVRGRAAVKLAALRRRRRGERAPVKLGALCPHSGRGGCHGDKHL